MTVSALPQVKNLLEVPTASDWCRRWTHQTPSWRHRRDGGFDSRAFEVHPLDEQTAKAYVLAHHYSGSYPLARYRLGLYRAAGEGDRLCGVAVFGVPMSPGVLTLPFPELRPDEAVECSRFVLADEVPGNAESWFLARSFEYLQQHTVHAVVSFADPVPRQTTTGEWVAIGHIGTIYQASNALYAGRSTPRTVKLLPDGRVFSARAAQKIRKGEQGCAYAAAQLVTLGAPPLQPGQDRAQWLREALLSVGARNLRHRGSHRYLFPLGANRRARENVRIGLPTSRAYPKQPDT